MKDLITNIAKNTREYTMVILGATLSSTIFIGGLGLALGKENSFKIISSALRSTEAQIVCGGFFSLYVLAKVWSEYWDHEQQKKFAAIGKDDTIVQKLRELSVPLNENHPIRLSIRGLANSISQSKAQYQDYKQVLISLNQQYNDNNKLLDNLKGIENDGAICQIEQLHQENSHLNAIQGEMLKIMQPSLQRKEELESVGMAAFTISIASATARMMRRA